MRGKMFYLETESQHSVITSGKKTTILFQFSTILFSEKSGQTLDFSTLSTGFSTEFVETGVERVENTILQRV
ncbi:hypothetical protein [Angelakisella massiliensis]|uniref:hypothetical protein n=1 Tax=Angelakisella massiliensis TaxID=1871018 RepID=UPI0024B19890|nr:hypothetical protein [Angelakisella massiliensis]